MSLVFVPRDGPFVQKVLIDRYLTLKHEVF
jgi:hypothetical protein